MEKVSRYIVISDSTYHDGMAEYQLVLSTRTARVVAVDAATAMLLRAGSTEEIPEHWRTALRQAQILVGMNADETAEILERNRAAAADMSAIHIALLPTSYCNMGCLYCGQEHTKGRLNADHRDRVRARVLRAIRASATRSARIDWFGAEPMIGYPVIRDLSKDFVRAADEQNVAYGAQLVTNGSLLNSDNVDVLIRECRVKHFEITLDGPPEVHDVHRPLKNGKGSFWRIVNLVREAAANTDYREVAFRFRTNIDKSNSASIPQYIDIMADLGFDQTNVMFYLAPVHSWGNDVTAVEVGIQEYAQSEAQWLDAMRKRGLSTHLVPAEAKKVVCPAVTRSAEIISSTGNIFSCSEYPLVPAAEKLLPLAHIQQSNIGIHRPEGPFDRWNDDIANGVSGCSKCIYLPTCGGSCPKAWHDGDIPCPSYKFNMQDRLDLLARDIGLVKRSAVAIS